MINLAQAKPGEIYLTKNGIEMEFIGCHLGNHKAGTCYVFSSIHATWAMQTNINGSRLDADGSDYDARCCDIVKKKIEIKKEEFIPAYEGEDMAGYIMAQGFKLPENNIERIYSITNVRNTAIIITNYSIYLAEPCHRIGFCIKVLQRL